MERRSRPHNGVTFEPTEERRRAVLTMTGFGITQADIATWLEIDLKTLRKHFRRELDTGVTEANMRVAQGLYTNATKNMHVGAQIFWMKARAGWKEQQELNIGGNGQSIVYEVRLGDPPPQPTLAAAPVIDADPDDGALVVTIGDDE